MRTRLVWWDEKSLYFEQRIQSISDGFIRAISYSRSSIVNSDARTVVAKYSENQRGENNEILDEIKRPNIREDLQHWLEFNALNSNFLAEERSLSS